MLSHGRDIVERIEAGKMPLAKFSAVTNDHDAAMVFWISDIFAALKKAKKILYLSALVLHTSYSHPGYLMPCIQDSAYSFVAMSHVSNVFRESRKFTHSFTLYFMVSPDEYSLYKTSSSLSIFSKAWLLKLRWAPLKKISSSPTLRSSTLLHKLSMYRTRYTSPRQSLTSKHLNLF